jgi:hypothetical protein
MPEKEEEENAETELQQSGRSWTTNIVEAAIYESVEGPHGEWCRSSG